MAKTGGAVKRLLEKHRANQMRRSHGGFARHAPNPETKLGHDRRDGAARMIAAKDDLTIPTYDHSMVTKVEPGKHRPIYFGAENRPSVTCYGNGTRRDMSEVARGAQVYVTELVKM